mmetsp:Transcript_10001/g.32837  ORF Transcript_10001/g.32837 Transcript_10001/m.32837 type:complete len:265 (+) Transcript_10001:1948-2742(+)
MKTSLCVKPSSRVPQPNRCHTPAVGTRQPFGLPVEPEVYMTYITSGGDHDTDCRTSPISASRRSERVSKVARLISGREVSSTAPRWSTTAVSEHRSGREKSTATTAVTPASSRMATLRGVGHAGSSCTNVAPALKHASCASGSAGERGRTMPTVYAPASSESESSAAARSWDASAAAFSCSSTKPKVSLPPALVRQTKAGRSATAAARPPGPGAEPMPIAAANSELRAFHSSGMHSGDHCEFLIEVIRLRRGGTGSATGRRRDV